MSRGWKVTTDQTDSK